MNQQEAFLHAEIVAHLRARIEEQDGQIRRLIERNERRDAERQAETTLRVGVAEKKVAVLLRECEALRLRVAELEGQIGEQQPAIVPFNMPAEDACPHAESTREWARWMAIHKGACVKHPRGCATRYHEGRFQWRGRSESRWRDADAYNTINDSDFHSGWSIVPNPETGQ